MSPEKDYNLLGVWLPARLAERRLSVNDLARIARMSITVVYMWIRDDARPSTASVKKVLKVLNEHPVWKQDDAGRWVQEKQEVTFEEMVGLFTERKNGRPVGSGSGQPSEIRTRRRV